MFKKILFLLIGSAINFNVSAQEPVAQWGAPSPFDAKQGKHDRIIGADESGFYAVRIGEGQFLRKMVQLERFDNSDKLIFSKDITPEFIQGNYLSYEDIYFTNGKLYILTSSFIKDEQKNHLYVQEIDEEGSTSKDKKEIDVFTATKTMNPGNFKTSISPDKSKILILKEEPFNKDGNEKIGLKVYDNNWKQLWATEETLPYEDTRAATNLPYVNNNGNAFVLKRLKNKYVWDYTVLNYNPSTKKLANNKVELGENVPSEIDVTFDADQNFVVAGFYTTKNLDKSEGWFIQRVNAEKGVVNNTKTPFTADYLSNFLSKNAAEKLNPLQNFKLRYVVPKPDGSVVLISEKYEEYKVSLPPQPNSPPAYLITYTAEDIGLLNIKKDGSLAWGSAVKKKQESKYDKGEFSSFSYALVNDKLNLLFNNVTILKDPKNKYELQSFNPDNLYPVTMVSVDNGGAVKTLPLNGLFNGTTFKMSLNPKVFYPINNNEVILLSENLTRTRYSYGKIKL